MKLILFLLLLLCALNLGYDFVADVTQETIAASSDQAWTPSAQKVFAATSYFLYQNRVAREAYAMQLKLFPDDADRATAYYRIARASERLSDYPVAVKYYQLFLKEFPNDKKSESVKGRLADIEGVYLEFAK